MSYHLYRINELFSNADGTIQFIELTTSFDNEGFWAGQQITAIRGGEQHSYVFPSNLPSLQTANTFVLLATQGFADLGLVTPDFIVPDGFLFTSGVARVNFADASVQEYNNLPLNGVHSLTSRGGTAVNSPTNFAGVRGTVSVGPPNEVAGTDGDDVLLGSAVSDRIDGKGGNDLLDGLRGNDQLLGGDGIDGARIHGARAASTVGAGASTVSGPDGNDTLSGIERLHFDDLSLAFDADGAAGRTAKLLAAVFGPSFLSNPTYAGIGISLFDSGQSYAQVAERALDAALGPAPSDADVVRLLYGNVAGRAPDSATVADYVGQIARGQHTHVSLTLLAADHEANVATVDLAGIAQQGLDYLPFDG